MAAELERIAAETGRSKADVLRLGLDFLPRTNASHRDDMHVGAWEESAEGTIRRERKSVGLP